MVWAVCDMVYGLLSSSPKAICINTAPFTQYWLCERFGAWKYVYGKTITSVCFRQGHEERFRGTFTQSQL